MREERETPYPIQSQLRTLHPRCRSIRLAPLLVIVSLSACAPTMYHLDGHPFITLTPITTFEGGWIAVDSCSLGVHALVELEIEAPEPRLRPASLDELSLRLGSSGAVRPRDLQIDGPLCWPRMRENIGYQPQRPARGVRPQTVADTSRYSIPLI